MAATTTDRNTPAKFLERQIVLPLKANEVIPAGAGVCSDTNGLAVNAADTAGLITEGRAAHSASYAAGDRYITVQRGVFEYGNNGNILQAHVGLLVTWVDNQTLGLVADTTNDIGAGYVDEITSTGVFISMLGGKVAAA